jgi:DNA-binding MarR family transcriptional regulator
MQRAPGLDPVRRREASATGRHTHGSAHDPCAWCVMGSKSKIDEAMREKLRAQRRPPRVPEPLERERCIAARIRLVHRMITSAYDTALKPWDLNAAQLDLLLAVAETGPTRPADLCRQLAVEPSTLSRTLRELIRRGLIDEAGAGGKQLRTVIITNYGRGRLGEARVSWRLQQEQTSKVLGTEGMAALDVLHRIARNRAADLAAERRFGRREHYRGTR